MGDLSCPVCLDAYYIPCHIIPCKHLFCGPCLRKLVDSGNRLCPLCRTSIILISHCKILDRKNKDKYIENYENEVEYETIFDPDMDVDIINDKLISISPGIDGYELDLIYEYPGISPGIYDPILINWTYNGDDNLFQFYEMCCMCFTSPGFYLLHILLYFLFVSVEFF